MSLNLILNSAISGLAANQSAISTTSQNVANANTVGYSRQIVRFEQRVAGNTPSGVAIAGIERFVDVFLTRELRGATSDGAAAGARDELFRQVAALFGAPGSDASLANDLSRFGVALDRLSVNPEDPALRFDAVATGETVARNTRKLAGDIQALRAETDRQIAEAVGEINEQLEAIFTLNREIAQINTTGAGAPDLEDQRDQAILALSELVGISTFSRENGEVVVFTSTGHALVDTQLRQLTYAAASTVVAGTVFGEIRAVPVEARTLTPIGDGEVLVTGGTSATVVSDMAGGRLAGLLSMRDGELPAIDDQVEAFAASLRDTVNAVHNDGTAFPAPNGLTGTLTVAGPDPFAGTGSVRIAILDAAGLVVGTPLDLDLTALGATTVDNLVITINTALGVDGIAALVNGKLEIRATNAANGVAINEGTGVVTSDGRGFAHHFGLNDFFVGAGASDLAVRADIRGNPGRVATGELSATAITGEVGATIGDNRIAQRLAEVFETALDFQAVGGLAAATVTLGAFVSTVIGLAATRAATAEDDVAQIAALVANLEFRQGAQSGVSVDEELSNLILFQNAYQASARVMTVAQELFDTLIEMVR